MRKKRIRLRIMETLLEIFLKAGGVLHVVLEKTVLFVLIIIERKKIKMNNNLLFLIFQFVILFSCQSENIDDLLEQIKLPAGFEISIYADNLSGARSMTQTGNGILFVGTRKQGVIYALVDKNNDNVIDEKYQVIKNLNNPNGVSFIDGSLYVAEIHRIIRLKDIINNLNKPPEPEIVFSDLPKDTWHGWKYLSYGPDGFLYFPIGAPCNVCESENSIYASLLRIKPDGTGFEIFASGIRNTVGFDWHPVTGELWFTDNGRDWLGDNLPPDELNHAPEKGFHFGFPHFHGNSIRDSEYVKVKIGKIIKSRQKSLVLMLQLWE